MIGVLVLAGLAVGTVAGLVNHNVRLYLVEGAVPSLVFALACLELAAHGQAADLPVRGRDPRPEIPQGPPSRRRLAPPRLRRAFQVITMAWGVGYLIEVAVRLVVIELTSTGMALLFSKLVPYAFALSACPPGRWLTGGARDRGKPSSWRPRQPYGTRGWPRMPTGG